MKKLYVQIKHPVSTGRPEETLLGKRLAKSTVQFTYRAVDRRTDYLPSG
jgi:hypothetical protein